MPAGEETFQPSRQQESLWRAEPSGPTACTQATVALEGPLERERLRRALRAVVARHEILRTTFAGQPGVRIPLQRIHDELEPGWEELEAAATDAAALDAARRAELGAPFDAERGPLLRALLVARAECRHTLVLTASSLIADDASLELLVGDLGQAYAGRPPLVAEPLQYADYAAWQRELESADDDEARASAEFWADATSRPGPPLPLTRTSAGAFAAREIELAIDDRLAAAIGECSRRYGASPAAFVHTALLVLLPRLGLDDATVGYVGHDRRHADLTGAIGAFARAVPLRASMRGTFAEALDDVTRTRAAAAVWQDHAPAEGAPAVTIAFIEQEFDPVDAGAAQIVIERLDASGSPFRTWLTCTRIGERTRAALSFDPNHLDEASAQRLARQLELVIAAAVRDPNAETAGLAILDADERERMTLGFSGPEWDVGPAPVHGRIAEWARRQPDRAAVMDDGGLISYGGLVAWAGGAYVPMHFDQPPARLRALLESTEAVAVVAPASLRDLAAVLGPPVLAIERDASSAATEPGAPSGGVSSGHLAYVIHTSGSTGAPKGVMVTHGNLANYVADITARLGSDQPQTFAMVTSSSTDLGNTALFGALCSGGTLLLVGASAATDGAAYARLAAATPIDVLKITPSHLRALLVAGDAGVLPRRRLVLGGERASWDLIAEIRALADCAILNHYGPTETTVGACTFAVPDDPGPFAPQSVPIGSPIANTRCYVLDARREPVPLGARGTLFISGAGVARGYIGQPGLTAERFHDDPFVAGARMYDSGDLVRRLPDGAIEFLGRADEQVKVRGYRVEPGEIEAALRAHPGVSDAAVIAEDRAGGDMQLRAHCVADTGVTEPVLREHLAALLPDHMVPRRIVLEAALPRTPSGKVDRQSLANPPAPPDRAGAAKGESMSPAEEAMAEIWAEVLGIERVGLHDDFFALGGHSLLATQVIARIRSRFAIDLPLHSLFIHLDVSSLAAELMRLLEAEGDDAAALVSELAELSDAQARSLLERGSGAPRC